MVSRNGTLVLSLGLRIGPACEAGLSVGMRRERVPPQKRQKEKKDSLATFQWFIVNEEDYYVASCLIKVTVND